MTTALVVDAEPQSVAMLRIALTDIGFRAVASPDGRLPGGWEAPGLVVVGPTAQPSPAEALRLVAETPLTAQAVIVVVIGPGSDLDEATACAMGASASVPMPSTGADLLIALHSHVQQALLSPWKTQTEVH